MERTVIEVKIVFIVLDEYNSMSLLIGALSPGRLSNVLKVLYLLLNRKSNFNIICSAVINNFSLIIVHMRLMSW